ncbi:hypothetical protein RhiirA4_476855 [Rhizophagus irregularis]|uniref:Uncharacterized protein n=1 Tax=Rhizophagus irregularis TaxID=588596 RepID=A0A2I1HC91_9GLOM|nr:hypothetical protein RhiirA4_476855 [Rhizophagus irregularis]
MIIQQQLLESSTRKFEIYTDGSVRDFEISYFPSSNKAELLAKFFKISTNNTYWSILREIIITNNLILDFIKVKEHSDKDTGACNSLLINADKDPIIDDELVNKMTFWNRTYSETFIDLIKGIISCELAAYTFLIFENRTLQEKFSVLLGNFVFEKSWSFWIDKCLKQKKKERRLKINLKKIKENLNEDKYIDPNRKINQLNLFSGLEIMEIHKNLVEEEQFIKVLVQKFSKAIPIFTKGKTTIPKTSERKITMDNCESKWCGDSSQHGIRCPGYNKLWFSSENLNDSRATNKLSIQTFKSTGKLDNTPRGRSWSFPGSSQSFNNFFQISTSETSPKSEESLVWNIIDWYPRNQSRVIANMTGVRQGKPAHFAMRCEWKFIGEDGTMGLQQLHRNEHVALPVKMEARLPNEDSNNINKKIRSKETMPKLSGDNETQYNEDLLSLRNLLKNKYPSHKETNKENLYNDEINIFVKTYNENLYYVEEDTHHLISVKEVEDKAINCYKEGKKTAIVVSEESLEPLNKVKEASKKSGEKRKKKKKKINKH